MAVSTAPREARTIALRDRLQAVFDRGCRDLVDEIDAADRLHTLCRGIGAALGLPLVLLVRRDEDGTLRMEATSAESRLWAEFTRIPERWDGTIAGHGPAAMAVGSRRASALSVHDEGFLPWHRAAQADGIASACAWPLETEEGAWALVLFATVEDAFEGAALHEVGTTAASGCARHLASAQRLDRRRILADALARAGNPAFIADSGGAIRWSNDAFSRLTGYPADEVVGRNPRFLASGEHGPRCYRDLWDTIRTGHVWRGETVDRDRDGVAFTAMQTITPFGEPDRATHFVAIYGSAGAPAREATTKEMS